MFFRRMYLAALISLLPGLLAAAQGAAGSFSIPATVTAINSPAPMSQRVVHYEIDARYDAKTHALEGDEVLTYHNLTGQPQDTFPFHLYLNAFQPTSTWVREGKREGTRGNNFEKWDPENYAEDVIRQFEVAGQGDLTSQLQFVHPDDDNADDKTVVQIHLPQAVPVDGYVQFHIKFHDQFGKTMERTGWDREFLLAGQWFPKVGVWWQGAWNCHQFHPTTEFFADFGVYDVKITVPQFETVGASGVEVSSVNNSDGTKTVAYHGDDIHDFAWTASPHFRIKTDTFQGQMGPVAVKVMMYAGHWDQAERHDRILLDTMDRFERWYGPYPYKTITLVDPEPGSQSLGMEYPTFITGGTTWLATPAFKFVPEGVVEHEFGHQYWYGMVATNEFEDAWMDEGINSYTEVKVLDSILGPRTSVVNGYGMTAGERETQRLSYISTPDFDPMTRNGWEFINGNSYGAISYGKTASVLLTLENLLGEDAMRQAMHTYFLRYRFQHPTKEDFLKTIEESSGRNLRWYYNQAVYGTQIFDYEVLEPLSYPREWYKENLKEKKGETEYVSNVWIHRKGDFVMPVEMEVHFDNGEAVREKWEGQDRWVRFSYVKKAKVDWAEIDPDHKIWIDRNNFNNSYIAKSDVSAAHKLANYWMACTQWLGQLLAWWLV